MSKQELSKAQIIIMAVAAGVCVANIYFNQPILGNIAKSFGATEAAVGIISVMAQAGYGLGLFFITPLGDKTNRKKLILFLMVLLAFVLLLISFVQSLFWMYIINLVIGLLAVAAQVILPMAASIDTKNRGRTVGIIFTGILIGILAARVFSGVIAGWLGWRYVYSISSVLLLISTVFFGTSLPTVKAGFSGNYLNLIKSTILQIKRFALLRRTAVLGALVFGVFCSFWTTLTFHLGGAPFHYGAEAIGLFGLLAIGGAIMAPVFGKLADKGRPERSQLYTTAMIIAGILLIKIFPYKIISFVLAVLLLDIGVQATQVTNVATIYTLDATAHSRINTVYMTSYFIGGSVGTYAGVLCWRWGGWQLVTSQLLLWSGVAFVVALISHSRTLRKN